MTYLSCKSAVDHFNSSERDFSQHARFLSCTIESEISEGVLLSSRESIIVPSFVDFLSYSEQVSVSDVVIRALELEVSNEISLHESVHEVANLIQDSNVSLLEDSANKAVGIIIGPSILMNIIEEGHC